MRVAGILMALTALMIAAGCQYRGGDDVRERNWNHDAKLNRGVDVSGIPGGKNHGKHK